jgi:hypothetical protein
MNQKAYQVVFPATLVIVMVAFLSTFFFASASLSYAASDKKKPTAAAKMSPVEHTESLIKDLQGKLQITDAQQELWKNLTQVMRENAKEMEAFHREKAENAKNMNAVDSLKFYSKVIEAHSEKLKKFIPPFEAFYASLSEKQKKMTDKYFRSGKPIKEQG